MAVRHHGGDGVAQFRLRELQNEIVFLGPLIPNLDARSEVMSIGTKHIVKHAPCAPDDVLTCVDQANEVDGNRAPGLGCVGRLGRSGIGRGLGSLRRT